MSCCLSTLFSFLGFVCLLPLVTRVKILVNQPASLIQYTGEDHERMGLCTWSYYTKVWPAEDSNIFRIITEKWTACLSRKPNPEEKAEVRVPTSVIKITISSHMAKVTFDLIRLARWFWWVNVSVMVFKSLCTSCMMQLTKNRGRRNCNLYLLTFIHLPYSETQDTQPCS